MTSPQKSLIQYKHRLKFYQIDPVFSFRKVSVMLCVFLNSWNTFSFGQLDKRDNLLSALAIANSSSEKVDLLTALSEWFIRVDFREAIYNAERALKIADSTRESKDKAIALTSRALVHWYNGEYNSSIRLNQEAIAIRKVMGDEKGIAFNHQKIALNYYYKADYEDAINYHTLALDGFRKAGDKREMASSLNQIALVYHKLGDYKNAARYIYEFSKVRQEFEGYQGRTYNLLETTPYFRSKEYFQMELDLQLKALEGLQKRGNDIDILMTCLNLADAQRELENPQKVLYYLQQADKYYEKVGWIPNFFGIGNAYLKVGEIDSAILTFRKSIEISSKIGTRISLMAAYSGLGEALFQKGQWKEAFEQYQIGLEMTTAMGNKLDVVLSLQRIANALLKNNALKEALSKCQQSIELAQKIKAKKQIRDGYFLQAQVLSAMGNFEPVYSIYQKGKLLADSLIAGDADLQFAQMQAQFELDKKTEDIKLLNQEKQIQEARIRNKDLLIYGFLIVVILSVLLALSIFLRYRQKNKANKVLREQKHQIEMLMGEIHHRVKNNLQVISSLLSIQSDQLKDENAKMAVLEGQSRVQAMGLIHENIYKSENFAFIQMDEYLKKLSSTLIGSFGFREDQIEVKINTGNLSVDVDTAILLGLIINELLTNSLKHAFSSTDNPCLWISLRLDENNLLTLEIKDNGGGFLVSSNQKSFGLRLVKELTRQMGGTIDFVQGPGFSVSLKFKKFKLAA